MTKDDDSIIKLCDFGFAKQAATADEILGTPCENYLHVLSISVYTFF
jgi:hypothetical protein